MSIKVLVADDSITIQKVIGIIFGGDEYSLTVVDNGRAAVDKAREIIPDILLIDALMPGMTGYEVAETVRATPSLAGKPILILTGSFEPFDEEKAKKCGADDFIAKPFESQQIITKVKELLELGNARELKAQAASAAEAVIEAAPQTPALNIAPPLQTESDIQKAAVPADIWGAFTPEIEQSARPVAAPASAALTSEESEQDVFAIVSDENDAGLIQNQAVTVKTPDHTGSQWVPVEENTFEFEENIAEPPQSTFTEKSVAFEEPSFGDISFEETIAPPAPAAFTAPEPVFTAPSPDFADFAETSATFAAPLIPPAPFAPLADPTPVCAAPPTEETVPDIPAIAAPTSAPAALSEEQLRAALTSVSKDVIERIVWEVVPDLAEALIREAIRKIKEGV